ncbi:MAG: hypothetical protein ACYTGN_18815 [Planctomycetota bacterium]|jgi:hypothetical protein
MSNVAKPLLVLALFGALGLLGYKLIWPALRPAAPERAPEAEFRGLPKDVVQAIENAAPTDAPELLRDAQAKFGGALARGELATLRERAEARATKAAALEADTLLEQHRYASAVRVISVYRQAWSGTALARTLTKRLDEVREEQQAIVDGRFEEADAMVLANREEGARETLITGWELETPYRQQLARKSEEIERILAARGREASDSPTAVPAPAARPTPVAAMLAPPPPLPGSPPGEVRRLADARALLERGKSLFAGRRFQPAIKALDEFVGYYSDMAFVERNRDAVDAMLKLSRHGMLGLQGLFNAASIKLKGRRVTLTYDFTDDGQYRDWEEGPTFEIQEGGRFEKARSGVRGTGGTSFLLRAFFENDVSLRAKARIEKPRSHGLLFCQDEVETRQLMLLATNHKIVEGENYVKERPGHSLLMWGRGTNVDVKANAPETAFIFKGDSKTKPKPPGGSTLTETFTVKGDHMVGTVSHKGDSCTLTWHTKGDDGRSIRDLRPGLFVLEAGVVFSDVVIQGTLGPRFERTMLDELIDIAATAE